MVDYTTSQNAKPDVVISYDPSKTITNAVTNNSVFKSYSGTDSATIINNVLSDIQTNKGGWMHIKGFGGGSGQPGTNYSIKSALNLPTSGHCFVTGDGPEWTVFHVPSTFDNDVFAYLGAQSSDAFFSRFQDFGIYGNRGQSGASASIGFDMQSTSFGFIDTVWENLFIRDCVSDNINVNSVNAWNNKIVNCTLEHAGRYQVYHQAGADFKMLNCKFLFGHGNWGVVSQGTDSSIIGCWFYKQDKTSLLLGAGCAATVFSNNRFEYSGQLTNNTYYDIEFQNSTGNVIVGNTFLGSDVTNKPKYALAFNHATVNKNVIANNTFPDSVGTTYATAKMGLVTLGMVNNIIKDNSGVNPFNKVTNFLDATAVTINPLGTTSTQLASTDYLVEGCDIIITCANSSNANNAIVIKDGAGNTVSSPGGTTSALYVPRGFKINWGAFTGTAGTVTAFFI